MRLFRLMLIIIGIIFINASLAQSQTIAERKIKKKIERPNYHLSKEQKKIIEEYSKEEQNSISKTNNLLKKSLIKLLDLETEDNPDFSQIEKTIEEIGQLYIDREKTKAIIRQKIRILLKEDQRLVFDTKYMETYESKVKEKYSKNELLEKQIQEIE